MKSARADLDMGMEHMSFHLLDNTFIIDYALKRKNALFKRLIGYSLDVGENIPLYLRESR